MQKVIVIGGGASGLFAAFSAAKEGKSVVLFEKNEKLGKKIYITGKGRCNLSNFVEEDEFLNNVVRNPKFAYSAINALCPRTTFETFENMGLKLKVEHGKRVFPASDKASDVTKTLEKQISVLGVKVKLNTPVKEIIVRDGKVSGVLTDEGVAEADSVVVCTGGKSYPLTGSTGDGYRFASETGHEIVPLKPALVGLNLKDYNGELQGISLKNVGLEVRIDGKKVYDDFGEMLFTHFGVSGPIVLSASCLINRSDGAAEIFIDMKPALGEAKLDDRLIREFTENNHKQLQTAMRSLVPAMLVKVILFQSRVSPYKNCSEVTRKERARLVYGLKHLNYKVDSLRPIEEAIVTSGGVSVKQINPKTMESKLVKGLYFAGEVLDIDAFTGGFNLQLAFSTGFLAGKNC